MRILAALILCLGLAGFVDAAQAIDGEYSVVGENPDGQGAYRGMAVVLRTDMTYAVLWRVGGVEYRGTGVLNEKQFSVVYQAAPDRPPGIAVYEVREDGSLAGIWTPLGGRQLGLEIWEPAGR